jgi:hypothetical protein
METYFKKRIVLFLIVSSLLAGLTNHQGLSMFAGASFRSYREDITVSVAKNANGITVTAHSKSRAALFDWGKNRENVSNFFCSITRPVTLSQESEASVRSF